MNYKELTELCQSKNILIQDLCEYMDMTRPELTKAMNKETLGVKKIKLLCEYLRISPALFFDAGTYGAIHKPDTSDTEKMNAMRKEIDYLKSIIKDKDEIINLLREKDRGYRGMVAEPTNYETKLKK